MMGTTIRFACLYFCVSLSFGNSSNLKHEWTNISKYYSTSNTGMAIQDMEVLAGTTDVIFAEDHCIRTKTEVITGKCDQPGDKTGHDSTYRYIRWFTQLDDRYILILDAAGFRKFDKIDKTTHYIPGISDLDISTFARDDDSECISFTIEANGSLIELCSSDLRIVDSSYYPFQDARAMASHANTRYVLTKNEIAKVDLASEARSTSIKGISTLVLFEDTVNKPVNFSDATKLHAVNSSLLIALESERDIIRLIYLDTRTVYFLVVGESSSKITSVLLVEEHLYVGYSNGSIAKGRIQIDWAKEGKITATLEKNSASLSPEMIALIVIIVILVIIVIILIATCIHHKRKIRAIEKQVTRKESRLREKVTALTTEKNELTRREDELTTKQNDLSENEIALTTKGNELKRRENRPRENQPLGSPPLLSQLSSSVEIGLDIIIHNPDDTGEPKHDNNRDNDGQSGSGSEDSSPASYHLHDSLLPNSVEGSATQ